MAGTHKNRTELGRARGVACQFSSLDAPGLRSQSKGRLYVALVDIRSRIRGGGDVRPLPRSEASPTRGAVAPMITETVLVRDLRRGDEIEMVEGGFERIEAIRQQPNRLFHLDMRDGSTIRIRPTAEIARKL